MNIKIKKILLTTTLLLLALPVQVATVATLLAAPDDCGQLPLDQAVQKANSLTTLLKIANFRADVNYMGDLSVELKNFLRSCGGDSSSGSSGSSDATGGKLALVCNYDCHLQLARYHLFMASDFPYLATSSGVNRNNTPLAPAELQKHAEQGLAILDRAFQVIGRQQASNNLREYYRQMNMLYSLKIRLLLVTGDIWYQTVSEARAKRLGYLLSESVGIPGDPGRNGDPNMTRAKVFYEQASWAIIEAKSDIPGDTSYDDLRTDLLVLESDAKTRLNSINQGLLYLNIDPDQFTSINFDDLKNELERVKDSLLQVESYVQSMVEQWYRNKQGENTRQIDENRVIKSQQTNLIAHRIGKLEGLAKEYSASISKDMNRLEGERDSYEYRSRIRQLELELTRKLEELQNRRQSLLLKKENDLIIMSKEAEMEKRNELRWLLNWKLTQMNLDVQIESLRAQITDYDRQKKRNDNRLEQIKLEEDQKKISIEMANQRIAEMNKRIEEITYRKNELYRQRREVTRQGICQIEEELSYVGEAVVMPFTPISGESACSSSTPAFTLRAYTEKMCGPDGNSGLRSKMLQQKVSARAFLVKCVMGSADSNDLKAVPGGMPLPASLVYKDTNIGSDPTLTTKLDAELASVNCADFKANEREFAKQIWDQEILRSQRNKEDLQERIKNLQKSINDLSGALDALVNSTKTFDVVLAAAEMAVMLSAAIPKTTVHVQGMSSGTSTEIDTARAVQAKLESVRGFLASLFQMGKLQIEQMREIEKLNREIKSLERAVGTIDVDLTAKSLALHRAHFELAGRISMTKSEIQDLYLQEQLADFDCKNDIRTIDQRVAALNAEHRRLIATINLEASQNDLLSYEISAQEHGIALALDEIKIIGSQMEHLNTQRNQLVDDNNDVFKIIDSINKRIERVNSTKGEVEVLASASDQVTNVINELRERQKGAMLALTDNELELVESRLKSEPGATEELVDILKKSAEVGLKNKELQAKILQVQEDTAKAVNKEQEELLTLVSKIDDADEKKNLFIASEEKIAEITRGLPEYLSSKRRELEHANLLLNLMRKRYNTVLALTGPDGLSKETSPYVKNAAGLTDMVNNIIRSRFFNEKQINIEVAEIVVPSTSGFTRAFSKNGHVKFEFSPNVLSDEMMAERGYFSLWNNEKFTVSRNLTIVDLLVGVQYTCSGDVRNSVQLIHKGSGMVFNNISENSTEVVPTLVTGPARSYVIPFYNLATAQDRVNSILDYWEGRFNVRNFPQLPGPINDTSAILPFMGAPLIGTYELIRRPSRCGFEDAVFTFYVIYSSAI
ncbi:MAG: hypothetical protein HQK50_07720 [Oligoflexia bacterium]|nr:hypothetical protein [Oligoflexia bacterium]MBF0365444.1 hypothetical protein [Oligoflexia bacterium]